MSSCAAHKLDNSWFLIFLIISLTSFIPENINLVPKVRLLNCVSNNNDSFVKELSIKQNVGYMFLQSFWTKWVEYGSNIKLRKLSSQTDSQEYSTFPAGGRQARLKTNK